MLLSKLCRKDENDEVKAVDWACSEYSRAVCKQLNEAIDNLTAKQFEAFRGERVIYQPGRTSLGGFISDLQTFRSVCNNNNK